MSYVFEDAPAALRELLRVTRAGGAVVASVMSTLGSSRHFICEVADLIAAYGDDDNETWACRQPGCLNGGTHLIFGAVRSGTAA